MGEFKYNTTRVKLNLDIKLLLVLIVLFFTYSSFANAALISGSLYDLSLQKESDAVVEINTLPKQLLVSKEGDYAFNVKPGNYTLYAYTFSSEATESVTVNDDGNYTLDIILEDKLTYPNDTFNLESSNLEVSTNLPSSATLDTKLVLLLLGLVLIIILLVITVYLFLKSSKLDKANKHSATAGGHKSQHGVDTDSGVSSNKSADKEALVNLVDEYEIKILHFIKKEKRTTQKDLRKEIPLSEAKISLVLTDLESKGKIRKIKKGRGNVLIFVKD